MAESLEQYLASDEKVLYHTPRRWLPPGVCWLLILNIFVTGLALLAVYGLSDTNVHTLVMVFIGGVATHAHTLISRTRAIQAAVTNTRVLGADFGAEPAQRQSIALEEVQAVEIFSRAVYVTKSDGDTVLLNHQAYAREIGLALASAAGLPVPRVPTGREVVAEYAAGLAGLIAWVFSLTVGWRMLSAANLEPTSFWQWILVIVAGVLAVIPAWPIGEAICATFLKSILDRESFGHWRRGFTQLTQERSVPRIVRRFLRWRRRLFDFVVGPEPRTDPNGHGRG